MNDIMITTAPGGGVITPDTTVDSRKHAPGFTSDTLRAARVEAESLDLAHGSESPSASDAYLEERRLFDAYIASVSATNAAYTAWYAAWRRALEAQS